MLSCESTRRKLEDYQNDTLESSVRQALDEHLSDCAACSALFQEQPAAKRILTKKLALGLLALCVLITASVLVVQQVYPKPKSPTQAFNVSPSPKNGVTPAAPSANSEMSSMISNYPLPMAVMRTQDQDAFSQVRSICSNYGESVILENVLYAQVKRSAFKALFNELKAVSGVSVEESFIAEQGDPDEIQIIEIHFDSAE